MKKLIILSLTAILAASPGLAERTKTVTVDNDKISGSKTIVRDGQGNLSIDGTVTRKSDGATATRDYDRNRTENGWTASGQRTDFEGRTSSFDFERHRTENGFEASGSAENRRGDAFSYSGYGTRDENGRERGRTITRNGDVVYDRLDTATRNDGGHIVRNTTVTRDPDFRPKKRFNPLRPNQGRKARQGGNRRGK